MAWNGLIATGLVSSLAGTAAFRVVVMKAVQLGRKTVPLTTMSVPSLATSLKLNCHDVTSRIDVVGPDGDVPTASRNVALGYCAWTWAVTESISAWNPTAEYSALTVPAGLIPAAVTVACASGAAWALGAAAHISPTATTTATSPLPILRLCTARSFASVSRHAPRTWLSGCYGWTGRGVGE